VFLQFRGIGLFCTNMHFSSLKMVIGRQYSFQKLIQFSQGKIVLDALPSNTDGFLSRDTCVFISIQLNRPILNKVTASPP
jgi:hypothetical protein